jgi:sugar phosphate isomerase/epimerase
VEEANRPNIGLCLDTFQTAGGEWGDPTTTSGLIEDMGGISAREAKLKASLYELANTIPKDKIYLLQISDAYKPDSPLKDKVDKSGLRPRGQWSHDYRPYPYNGGYLPVEEVAKAVLQTGTRCWFSMEVFDGGKAGKEEREPDFERFTLGAMNSIKKLLDTCSDTK